MILFLVIFYLYSVIGYSKEQFDRVAIAVISVLSHSDADYRLIAATTLVNLQKETKTIVIALLNSFLNDSRVNDLLAVFLLDIYFLLYRFLFDLNVVNH